MMANDPAMFISLFDYLVIESLFDYLVIRSDQPLYWCLQGDLKGTSMMNLDTLEGFGASILIDL